MSEGVVLHVRYEYMDCRGRQWLSFGVYLMVVVSVVVEI